jgi:hypothetical protein
VTVEAIDRTKLLPRSGAGVVDPWLVLAPPGSPVVRIDLRAVDRVAVSQRGWSLRSLLRGSRRHHIEVACGEFEIEVYVADGRDAIANLVRQAEPIVHATAGRRSEYVAALVLVDDQAVTLRDDLICVGALAFRTKEVRDYASRGANLPLTGGRPLQAAVAMLVVAAADRERGAL